MYLSSALGPLAESGSFVFFFFHVICLLLGTRRNIVVRVADMRFLLKAVLLAFQSLRCGHFGPVRGEALLGRFREAFVRMHDGFEWLLLLACGSIRPTTPHHLWGGRLWGWWDFGETHCANSATFRVRDFHAQQTYAASG